jgi:hypothetical protein
VYTGYAHMLALRTCGPLCIEAREMQAALQAHAGFSHRRTVRTCGYSHMPAFLIGEQSAHAGYRHVLPFLTGVLSAHASYSVIHAVRQSAHADYSHMRAIGSLKMLIIYSRSHTRAIRIRVSKLILIFRWGYTSTS